MPVTTAVVLGGGLGRRFGVLTSRDSPKALLPVANAPLLSYPIEWVAASGLQEALIVAGAPLLPSLTSHLRLTLFMQRATRPRPRSHGG
jgi:translation initiation factor eIF-2B subunit gamma